ncbi:MAG: DNA-directed RNA polymerase subunit omega [Alphaproteobacteria bacterium]|jgi:DNA-directed RNA polymerase subunit omega|nr:DNA-directed RNA polymerase subunit omega [Alphaproteobacteria bacterium]MCV6599854.1 DNA-directed RNA polymerase subunit omega [Alphaproteobacteria bacterium]
MARITVEDCLSKVDNHFDLVIVAAKRARQISNGAFVDYDGEFVSKEDKAAIIALREIAHDLVSVDELKENVIKGYRKISEIEEANDFEEDIEFDSFDDPEMISANVEEEIKEDELSILDEITEEADKA